MLMLCPVTSFEASLARETVRETDGLDRQSAKSGDVG